MPPLPGGSPVYALLMMAGIGCGAVYWLRASKSDGRLPALYFSCLAGAFLGAKLSFLFSEGWLHLNDPQRWQIWLSGKSIMGALPGGWIAVEVAKRVLEYPQATGDRFAILLPAPLILGRIGCLTAGCCKGIECGFGTWPAVPVEICFQVLAIIALLLLRWKHRQQEQHFHLYLMAYGLFRFCHEFLRATPKPFFGLSGYQIIGLATAIAAGMAYHHRNGKRQRTLREVTNTPP